MFNGGSSTLFASPTKGNKSTSGGRAMPSYKSTSSASVIEERQSSPTKTTPAKYSAQYRSRIDEYFRSTISGRDV